MKSYIAKPADIDHKWYVIDAEDKTSFSFLSTYSDLKIGFGTVYLDPRILFDILKIT